MNILVIIVIGALAGIGVSFASNYLPKKLNKEWHTECTEFLALTQANPIKPIASLSKKSQILLFFFTIVVTYFIMQYTSLPTNSKVFVLLLSWGFISLIAIDFKHQLLPDELTLGLLWVGLIANLNNAFVPITSAIWGAVGAYLFLYILAKVFHLLCKKEGMGHGDFKLLACIGAWQGFALLPLTLLIAAILGLLAGIGLIIKNKSRNTPYAFGPYLAIAGWITLLYGNQLNLYLLGLIH